MTSDEAIERAVTLTQMTPSSAGVSAQISQGVLAYSTLALALQGQERVAADLAAEALERASEPFMIPMRGM